MIRQWKASIPIPRARYLTDWLFPCSFGIYLRTSIYWSCPSLGPIQWVRAPLVNVIYKPWTPFRWSAPERRPEPSRTRSWGTPAAWRFRTRCRCSAPPTATSGWCSRQGRWWTRNSRQLCSLAREAMVQWMAHVLATQEAGVRLPQSAFIQMFFSPS